MVAKDTPNQEDKASVLLKVLANSRARQRQAEIAYKAAAKREDCSLYLAYVLLGLKSLLGVSYDVLAVKLGNACDPSALYKIAYRQQGVRLRTYKILTQRINEIRVEMNLEPLTFEFWTEYK